MSDWIIPLITALGSAGFFGLIEKIISRRSGVKQQLERIERKCDDNAVAITRVQLLWLIKSQPKNHATICKTAKRYFVDQDGDGEAWDEFEKWSQKENVSTSWYTEIARKEQSR